MCSTPVKVKNPYYKSGAAYYFEGETYPLDSRFVSRQPFIEVPCGNCPDCRDSYVMSIIQRAQMESLSSYVYMVTITYDDEHLPFLEFTYNSTNHKHYALKPTYGKAKVYYADVSHIQSLMKRLRNSTIFSHRDFRYLLCTEYGSEGFRPHFHILFFVAKHPADPDNFPSLFESKLKWTIFANYGDNIGTRKHPFYRPYFQYRVAYRHGQEYSTYTCKLVRDYNKDVNDSSSINSIDSVNAAINYVVSYINKPSRYDELVSDFVDDIDDVLDNELSRKTKLLLKSRCIFSKGFGWGFDSSARKVKPSLRFVPVTLMTAYLSDQLSNVYPKSFDVFQSQEPARAREIASFARRLTLSRSDNSDITLSEWISKNVVHPLDFLLVCKYFPHYVQSWMYATHFQQSSFFKKLLPVSGYNKDYTSSLVYQRLRRTIDQVPSDIPFIPFEYIKDNVSRYVPLCRYYRRYVCCLEDYQNLFFRTRSVDKDDYLSKFESNLALTSRRLLRQQMNELKHNARKVNDEELFSVPNTINNFLSFAKLKKISIFVPTLGSLAKILGEFRSK